MKLEISDIIRKIRMKHGLSQQDLANQLGVSTMTIHSYEKGKRKPSMKIYSELLGKYPEAEESVLGANLAKKGEEPMLEGMVEAQAKTTKLQDEKLERQSQQIEQLKSNTYPAQSNDWDGLVYDFATHVEMSIMPMKRRVVKSKGLEKLSNRLGVDVEEYFSVGRWHEFKAHPIEKIIDQKSIGRVDSILKTLPTIYESLKLIMTEHYLKVPVVYRYGSHKVYTLCHSKINWGKTVLIHTKTEFMNGDAE